jgi:hypothetical protein
VNIMGLLVNAVTAALAHWRTGALAHWRTGALAHWRTGALAHYDFAGFLDLLLGGSWPTLPKRES